MANRKPISKSLRFEVFKRDKFTCQYCGRSIPDVVLEVDHIKPVAKGGDNDILNLVTACRDCNRGKGTRELSDNSVLKKQQAQIQEMAECREQLEMMMAWREELRAETEIQVDIIVNEFESATERSVTDTGRNHIKKWLKEFSVKEILNAVEIATSCYEPNVAFGKISGICYITRKQQSNNDMRYYYANYILKALRRIQFVDQAKVRKFVFECLQDEDDFERVKQYCLNVRNWTEFKQRIAEEFGYRI